MKIEYAKVSAVGDRTDNQDRAAVVVGEDAAIMLVFDGMGGHSDGARAAEVGMKVVQDLFTAAKLPIFDPQGFLYMALARAHDEVVKIGLDQAIDFRPRATCAICLAIKKPETSQFAVIKGSGFSAQISIERRVVSTADF